MDTLVTLDTEGVLNHADEIKQLSLSVFMPFYNEEKNIEKAIAEVATYLSNSSRISDYEIIIVNDASTDATQVIAEEMAIQNNKVHVVTHEVNKGYGGAITTGIESCTLEYIFFTDGDLQFDIKDLDSLLACVPAYDAVLGYRVERKDPLMRKLNAYVWNRLNYYIYGLQIRDINCAFKLFKSEILTSLPLRSTGAMISSEILLRLKKTRTTYIEVPVRHFPRLYGKPTGAGVQVIILALKEFFALRTTL